MSESDVSELQRLVEDNRGASGRFEGGLGAPPRRHLAILTCMDARVHPLDVLGLTRGDAHVIANAGGRASDDALRSLAVSVVELGVRDVAVIHHSRCGMATDEDALADAIDDAGIDLPSPALGAFDDIEASVHQDVERVRATLPDDITVAGFVLDVDDGLLRPVT